MFTIEFINETNKTLLRKTRKNIAAAIDCGAYAPEGYRFNKIYMPNEELMVWTNVQIINSED